MKSIYKYFLVFFVLVFSVGCKKNHTGCADGYAANYNKYINKNNSDSSCYYYSKFSIGYTRDHIKKILDEGGVKIELTYEENEYLVYDSTKFEKLNQFGNDNDFVFSFDHEGSIKDETIFFETKLHKQVGTIKIIKDSIVLRTGDDYNFVVYD